MEKEPFKVNVVDYQLNGLKIKLIVDFGYGWKEQIVENEDGTTTTYYQGHVEREIIELPFLMDYDQIKKYLETYWSNKYGALDTYYQTLNELDSLKGLQF